MLIKKTYQDQFTTSKLPYLANEVDIKTFVAPVGGWDAISPLANMQEQFAPILDNWVPRPGFIETRGGYNAWAQAITDQAVNTLMAYRPPGGSEVLFAASGDSIYNVSTYAIPSVARTGLLGDKWQYTNFTVGGGGASYLLMVNGFDPYTAFDGTNWTNPSITGVSTLNLINISVFKRRIWFIENNSTSAWFLATDAIQGAATRFDLGPSMSKGSYLVAMGNWTIDGGNGPDDYAVFITNKGQAIVYRGTDPANSAVWIQVGVFNLPPPLGRRCLTSAGSDLLYISMEGLLPISKALPFDPSGARSSALTNRIQNAMLNAAIAGRTLFGWQTITFPQQALLILNVPLIQDQSQNQFVMNTITGAWTRFTGWNANCFEIFNESLYFGDNLGNVNLAYAGPLDLVSPINYDCECAFNYFGQPGRVKNMTMVRPFIFADGQLTPLIGVDQDFQQSSPSAPVSILEPLGGIWDESLWDVALWSTGASTFANWQSVNALGTALAVRFTILLSGAGTGSSGSVLANSVFDTGAFDTMVFDGNGAITRSGDGIPVLQVNAFQGVLAYGSPV